MESEASMESEVDRILGGKLRKIRVESGLSQLEVAQRLNETQAYISAVERGRTRLYLTDSISYARCIGMKPYDMFRETVRALGKSEWLRYHHNFSRDKRLARMHPHHKNTSPLDEASR